MLELKPPSARFSSNLLMRDHRKLASRWLLFIKRQSFRSQTSTSVLPGARIKGFFLNMEFTNFFFADLKRTAPYCRELPDGDYSAGCVSNFITCTSGVEVRNNCPDSTVFSNVLRRCVPYEECVFLMYRILASSHPVHTLGEVKKLYNITGWYCIFVKILKVPSRRSKINLNS